MGPAAPPAAQARLPLAGRRDDRPRDARRTGELVLRHQRVRPGHWPVRRAAAVLWETSGLIVALGTPGEGESEAVAINDQGQIVGWSGNTSDNSHAIVWQIGIAGWPTVGRAGITMTGALKDPVEPDRRLRLSITVTGLAPGEAVSLRAAGDTRSHGPAGYGLSRAANSAVGPPRIATRRGWPGQRLRPSPGVMGRRRLGSRSLPRRRLRPVPPTQLPGGGRFVNDGRRSGSTTLRTACSSRPTPSSGG